MMLRHFNDLHSVKIIDVSALARFCCLQLKAFRCLKSYFVKPGSEWNHKFLKKILWASKGTCSLPLQLARNSTSEGHSVPSDFPPHSSLIARCHSGCRLPPFNAYCRKLWLRVTVKRSENRAINIFINLSLYHPQDSTPCNAADPAKRRLGFGFCGADPYAKAVLPWEQG